MADLFCDTSGWAAWLLRREALHVQATAIISRARQDGTRLVTSNYVMCELVALLTSPMHVAWKNQGDGAFYGSFVLTSVGDGVQMLQAWRFYTWIRSNYS